jgi:hypothetical protein
MKCHTREFRRQFKTLALCTDLYKQPNDEYVSVANGVEVIDRENTYCAHEETLNKRCGTPAHPSPAYRSCHKTVCQNNVPVLHIMLRLVSITGGKWEFL